MIEVKNKTKGPVQLVVRSREAPRSFTTLIVYGIGAGKNVVYLEDEVFVPEVAKRLEKNGMITTKYVSSKDLPSKEL